MSETVNETLPAVNVVKKKWINFGDGRTGEAVDDLSQRSFKESEDVSIESPNVDNEYIQLPKPPRKHRKSDSDRHDRSTPYSPTSSSTVHYPDKSNVGRSADRSNDRSRYVEKSNERSSRLNEKSNYKSTERSDDCALSIPDTMIKSNSSNLQNVPLRNESTPDAPSPSNSQPNSRFSEWFDFFHLHL